MKRLGDLFDKIVDKENIKDACTKACRGRHRQAAVRKVEEDVDYYVDEVQDMLVHKTFTTAKYNVFKIRDRGKEREISSLPFYPDRIVQWALMNIMKPVFMNRFLRDVYAAIPGERFKDRRSGKMRSNRGTHGALRRIHRFMKLDPEGTQYCLKLDVKKFFPSIDQSILKSQLRRIIKDKDVLWLLDDIIDSCPKGIPIGNLTSQYFGNFYLTQFDHWMKEEKKVKYYLRYMDDMVILSDSKEYLHELRKEIDEYLKTRLNLTLKENWQVFPTYVRGVDFVGYRSFGKYSLLRKGTKKRLKVAAKKLRRKLNEGREMSDSDNSRVGSYKGILEWGDCNRLQGKTIKKFLEVQKENGKKSKGQSGDKT